MLAEKCCSAAKGFVCPKNCICWTLQILPRRVDTVNYILLKSTLSNFFLTKNRFSDIKILYQECDCIGMWSMKRAVDHTFFVAKLKICIFVGKTEIEPTLV